MDSKPLRVCRLCFSLDPASVRIRALAPEPGRSQHTHQKRERISENTANGREERSLLQTDRFDVADGRRNCFLSKAGRCRRGQRRTWPGALWATRVPPADQRSDGLWGTSQGSLCGFHFLLSAFPPMVFFNTAITLHCVFCQDKLIRRLINPPAILGLLDGASCSFGALGE